MRVFALSDIHLDFSVNLQWLENLSLNDYQDDILILAGDISDHPAIVARCFELLTRRFNQVCFVPGNHDLWINKGSCHCSLEKFDAICQQANDYSIITHPLQTKNIAIVPLLSWYDFSFGQPGVELLQVWMDFRRCIWPENFNITEFFHTKNKPFITNYNTPVISFSHFLPRIDVMPPYIPQSKRYIYPVLGSELLDRQIRSIGSSIHVYGHSHVNRRAVIDGVTYINNAFGYPTETRITAKELLCIYEE